MTYDGSHNWVSMYRRYRPQNLIFKASHWTTSGNLTKFIFCHISDSESYGLVIEPNIINRLNIIFECGTV